VISLIAKISTLLSWFVLVAMSNSVQAQPLTCEDGSCSSSPSDIRFGAVATENCSLSGSNQITVRGFPYWRPTYGQESTDPPAGDGCGELLLDQLQEPNSFEDEQAETQSKSAGFALRRPMGRVAKGVWFVVGRPVDFAQRAISSRVWGMRLVQRSRCR
jgi:hypothetical protein